MARRGKTESDDAQNWFRFAPQKFNITYNHGHNYELDFAVETEETIYLVEVKGEEKLNNLDVIAKKKGDIQYCDDDSCWTKLTAIKSSDICSSRQRSFSQIRVLFS